MSYLSLLRHSFSVRLLTGAVRMLPKRDRPMLEDSLADYFARRFTELRLLAMQDANRSVR